MGNFRRDERGGGRSFGGSRGGFGRDRHGFGMSGNSGRREMFSAVCDNCGKNCQIPFKPSGGKPVYCSECFEKMNGGHDSRRPARSEFRPQNSNSDQNRAQLDAINAKLDKILAILTPTPVEVNPELEPTKTEKKVKKIASKKKE